MSDHEFGTGAAGQSAREIVVKKDCVECGGKAVRTIDFDLRGELWQIPACASYACYEAIIATAQAEMERIGQIDRVRTFGMNGLGRGY